MKVIITLLFVAITCGKVSLWLWKSLENSEIFSPSLWPPCSNKKPESILKWKPAPKLTSLSRDSLLSIGEWRHLLLIINYFVMLNNVKNTRIQITSKS